MCSGAAGSVYAQAGAGTESSVFNNLGFWAKASRRTDGELFTDIRVDLGATSAFTGRMLCGFSLRADGKWRFYTIDEGNFGVAGAFVKGTTAFSHIRFVEAGKATALTLTGSLSVGAVTATLNSGFGGVTAVYPVRFSSNEVRHIFIANGDTVISWGEPLTATATTSAVYSDTRLQQITGDKTVFGPVYRNCVGKAFAFTRFDDMLIDQYTPRISLTSTPYAGLSGVTIPIGVPQSCMSIVNAFGLKANLFILTKYLETSSPYFLTAAMCRELQDNLGWNICFQSHDNPFDLNNAGIRMLGPYGYNLAASVYGSISSVDTSANTITTANAHKVVNGSTFGGPQGYEIKFFGTNLPAPLVIDQTYWLRSTTTTAFTVHPTENDASFNTNIIDLTTTGTPANFGYRHARATNDGTAIRAEFETGRAVMQKYGLNGWRHYAPNQGAIDAFSERKVIELQAAGNMQITNATYGATGFASGGFSPTIAVGSIVGGGGYTANLQVAVPTSTAMTIPVSVGTESVAEADIRTSIDEAIRRGGIISNYHHFLTNETSLRRLIAWCDHVKLRVDQGLLKTGTCDDLYQMLKESNSTIV